MTQTAATGAGPAKQLIDVLPLALASAALRLYTWFGPSVERRRERRSLQWGDAERARDAEKTRNQCRGLDEPRLADGRVSVALRL